MESPAIFIPRLLLRELDDTFEPLRKCVQNLLTSHNRVLPDGLVTVVALLGFCTLTGVANAVDTDPLNGALNKAPELDIFPVVTAAVAVVDGSALNETISDAAAVVVDAGVKSAGVLHSFLAFLENIGISCKVALLAAAPIIAYGLWYYNQFIVRPQRQRHAPAVYPYQVPFVGHTISLARDPQGTVTRARQYFGNSREPFRLYAFGVEFVFVTNPKHVSEVYKHTETLTHDIFLAELLEAFKVTHFARRQIFFEPNKDGSGLQLLGSNPASRSLARMTVDLFHEQLRPGPRLNELTEVTRKSIDAATQWTSMSNARYVISEHSSAADYFRDISLLNWCEDLLLNAANQSFFGSALHQVSPDILSDFLAFDAKSWKAMFHLPSLLSQDMIASREKLVTGIERYFQLPLCQRPGANWFIEQQEAEMRHLGISTHDLSRCIAMIFWVINTNAYKLLFWMLVHLFSDPDLLLHVTAELRRAYEEGNWTIDRMSDPLSMPFTNALFYECLRITNSSSSARHVTRDTVIGGKLLRSGMRVLVPYRQLHLDELAWGSDAEAFQLSRFLLRLLPSGTVMLNEGSTGSNGSYRPFGGGRWLCPGRHLAKVEIFMAMAHLLCRFDVEVAPGQEHQEKPMMDETLPGIGIVAAVQGTDLKLRVREGKDWGKFEEMLRKAKMCAIETTMNDPREGDEPAKVRPGLRRSWTSYMAKLKEAKKEAEPLKANEGQQC
jgi:Cytochrome P450